MVDRRLLGKRRIRDRMGRGVLYTIVFGYVAILLLAPVLAIVWGAFADGPLAFFAAVSGGDAPHALFLSVVIALVAVAVNTVFGTIVAYVLVRDRFRGRDAVNALVDLPFAISPVIVGFALLLLFGRNGWLAPLIQALDVSIVFAWPGMAIATAFVSLPFVIRQVGLVLEQVGTDQEQAAYTLGASPLRTFVRVTLPNIRWGLVNGVLLTTARALGEFGAVLVVSGGLAGMTETGTLFVFRSLDDRRDLAAYSLSVALAALSIALLSVTEILRRRQEATRR